MLTVRLTKVGGPNLYSYAGGNPIVGVDVVGLSSGRGILWALWSRATEAIISFPYAYALTSSWACGVGPDRYVFGPESVVSRQMANSAVIRTAVQRFESGRFQQGERIEFRARELLYSLFTPTLMDDFVGSLDTVCVTRSDEGGYLIRAVNLTNMASFTKYIGTAGNAITGIEQSEFMLPPYARCSVTPSFLPLSIGIPGGQISQAYKIRVRR